GRDAISHPLSRVPPGYSTGPRPRATGHGLSRHHHKRRKAHARKPPPRRKRRGLAAAGTQKAQGLRAGGRLPPAARQCGRGLLRGKGGGLMKRELAAAAVLILLLAGSWWNLKYLRDFTGGLSETLDLSRAYCEAGQFE